jgi:DNA-binding response OmpR family regulator
MVEDEMILAFMLEDLLLEAGFAVQRASRIDDALALLESEDFDAAVLDVNLGGEPVFPLADRLRERGVPILFATGYGASGLPTDFADCPVLQKPYPPEQLAPTVAGLVRARATG